ncbi:hypothetical protein ACFL6U_12280 [Planctomycetota bacterium]
MEKKKCNGVTISANALIEGPQSQTVGNFRFGEWIGEAECRHGHKIRFFNVGCDHFIACDNCRTFMHVGSNVRSGYWAEDKAAWKKNHDSVQGYKLIG